MINALCVLLTSRFCKFEQRHLFIRPCLTSGEGDISVVFTDIDVETEGIVECEALFNFLFCFECAKKSEFVSPSVPRQLTTTCGLRYTLWILDGPRMCVKR